MEKERYKKMYTLDAPLYTRGAPVIIEAGVLLSDTDTGAILAQLKYRNISDKPIKSMKVSLDLKDDIGRPIEGKLEYRYMDLSVNRDGFFGDRSAILISEKSCRAFSVMVDEVAFDDNTVWCGVKLMWRKLPGQQSIREVSDSNEFIRLYTDRFGWKASYFLKEYRDLWFCCCGALNHENETQCHICGQPLETMQALDMEAFDTEVKAEEAKAEEERIEAEHARARKMKILKMSIAAAACLTLLILIPTVIAPKVYCAYEDSKYGIDVEVVQNDIDSAENAGDTAKFGYYEQDGDTSNGKEPIEWEVTGFYDFAVEMKSKKLLDLQPYNETDEACSWETCDLRKWLNDDFKKEAFPGSLEKMIFVNSLGDKVGILGIETEDSVVNINSNENNVLKKERDKIEATEYLIDKINGKGKTALVNGYKDWWLYCDESTKSGFYVDHDGVIQKTKVTDLKGIRPVIIVQITTDDKQ